MDTQENSTNGALLAPNYQSAIVAAVLIAVGASEFFTQDLEPLDQNVLE
jgi:hypothetical protein